MQFILEIPEKSNCIVLQSREAVGNKAKQEKHKTNKKKRKETREESLQPE